MTETTREAFESWAKDHCLNGHLQKQDCFFAWQAATERATPQWQDIATAPMDGTNILLWGFWAGEVTEIAEAQSMEIGFYSKGGDYPGFDWRATGGDIYRVWCKPTHWMPLPPSPAIRQGGDT